MATRISDQPAYVLHRYDWSESSLILEVLTRDHGRIALLAKGVKKPSSSFRPVLLPLQPLRISFGGDAEIRTLKSAEWQGGHVMPTGESLMSGYYLNELLMRLLARDDPHPSIFDAYAATVQLLALQDQSALPLALRAFELKLLREVGLLPDLNVQSANLSALQLDQHYVLAPEVGLRAAYDEDRHSLSGRHWQALHEALAQNRPVAPIGEQTLPALKNQLRALLHYHCDVRVLKTRQLMHELQHL